MTRHAPDPGQEWDWERIFNRMLIPLPWVLLLPAAVISQLSSDLSRHDRVVTLGLVAVAGAWVYAFHTRADARRAQTGWMVTYFVGLLVLFTVLMSRDIAFVLFAITGFFHAFRLRPWPFGLAGVFGTSVVLNTMTMGFPQTPQSLGVYIGVVAVQTVGIGAGVVFSGKVDEQNRLRAEMVRKLQNALEENAGCMPSYSLRRGKRAC